MSTVAERLRKEDADVDTYRSEVFSACLSASKDVALSLQNDFLASERRAQSNFLDVASSFTSEEQTLYTESEADSDVDMDVALAVLAEVVSLELSSEDETTWQSETSEAADAVVQPQPSMRPVGSTQSLAQVLRRPVLIEEEALPNYWHFLLDTDHAGARGRMSALGGARFQGPLATTVALRPLFPPEVLVHIRRCLADPVLTLLWCRHVWLAPARRLLWRSALDDIAVNKKKIQHLRARGKGHLAKSRLRRCLQRQERRKHSNARRRTAKAMKKRRR